MLIFLYGEDDFRSRRKLKELKQRFLREVDPSGNSLSVLNGEKIGIQEINEAVSASSLLSKKRMIIIENLFSNKSISIFKELRDYFKKKKLPTDSDNIIVFWDFFAEKKKLPKVKDDFFKFLSKEKFSQEFKVLSNTEATAWAKKEIVARGGKISNLAAMELTSLLGSDLWQINNEIDKLINNKAGQKLKLVDGAVNAPADVEISAEDVKNLVRGQFDENIFALTDALSAKNKALVARVFEEQIKAGLTDTYLLNMITRQFRILLQIRQALDSGIAPRAITPLLKIHPFVAQKGVNQARNFSLVYLKKVLSKLVEIDYLMKSGKIDIKTSLSLLMAKI